MSGPYFIGSICNEFERTIFEAGVWEEKQKIIQLQNRNDAFSVFAFVTKFQAAPAFLLEVQICNKSTQQGNLSLTEVCCWSLLNDEKEHISEST